MDPATGGGNRPSMPHPQPPPRYLELDSLRGVAAILVVLAHVDLRTWFWTWSLMDMFFTLSAFLLTRVVLRQSASWSGVISYYGRRIERIWPLYLLTVTVLFLLTLYLNSSRGANFDLGVFFRLYTFTQYTELMFQPVPDYQYLYYARHLWSLAVEEQFYVVLPLALLLFRRLPVWVWLPLVLGLIAGSTAWRHAHTNLYVIASHADAFALGGLTAIGLPLLQQRRRWAVPLLALVAAVGMAGFLPYALEGYQAWRVGGPVFDYRPGPATASIWFWAATIALLALYRGHPALGFLRGRLTVHLGCLSYALYLCHFPILRLLPPMITRRFPEYSQLEASLLCLPLVFMIAELLYFTIDRPLQRRRAPRIPESRPVLVHAGA